MHPAPKSPALIPTTTRPLPLAVAAKGARIFDESGLDYIDASSGPLAVSVGHGHPKVLQALRDQFAAVDYVHRTQFRNEAAGRLAELVTARLGGGLDHVLFVGSGSEANELAMKFAHLYWAVQGRGGKHRFASSSLSYHGNTVGALGVSGQPRYAAPYRPLVNPGEHITAPQVYRLEVPAGSTAAAECITRLRAEFAQLDVRRTAAVLFEGVGGSGSGVLVPPPGADDSHVVHGSTLAELTDQLRQRLVKYRAETGGAELAPDFTEQRAAAIARFNRLAADGVDVDFHRGEKPVQLMFNGAVAPSQNGPNPTMYLCVPRISSMALSSRVALPAVRP